MKQFSELGIVSKKSFVGNKIYIENNLNKEVVVEFFDIKPSKKNDGTECLQIQIKLDGDPHVVFTSSTFLMNQIRQLKDDDFPFTAKIVKINRHYEFT